MKYVFLASFLFAIILNALKFMYFVTFGTHTFGDKTLQLLMQLSKLLMNGYYLSSTGLKSKRVGLAKHGSSFKNIHFVWLRAKDSLKLNNTVSTCLIRLIIIFHFSWSLSACECLITRIYQ